MPLDKQATIDELERARVTFHELLASASPADLHRRSNGTRWTNQQLLFHMLFGYLVVRVLLVLVRGFGRLPECASRVFASVLDAANRPFHLVNYLGSCAGATLGPRRMARMMDRVIASLQRRLIADSERRLARSMHFPTRWDPFFMEVMTLADVYRYPTQHFDFHRRQLSLPDDG